MAASCQCNECKKVRAEHEFREMLRREDQRAGQIRSEEIAASLRRVEDDAKSGSAREGRLRSAYISELYKGFNVTFEGRVDPSTMDNLFQPLRGYFNTSKEKPMSSSNVPTPEGIIKDIRQMPEGTDLSGIKSAVERAEKERKERIEKALEGQADLEILKGTKARQFVVMYWYSGEARRAEGTEYPVKYDKDGDPEGCSVILNVSQYPHPFNARFVTMEKLRKYFVDAGYPFHIAYFDK